MSYMDLLAVTDDWRFIHVKEFGNSHGWLPHIWSRLAERYVDRAYVPSWARDQAGGLWIMQEDWLQRWLWRQHNNPNWPLAHRIVLACTFNRAIVYDDTEEWQARPELDRVRGSYTSGFSALVWALREFEKDLPSGREWQNHVPGVADFVEAHVIPKNEQMAMGEPARYIAVAWYPTSCGENLWRVAVPCATCGCTCNTDPRDWRPSDQAAHPSCNVLEAVVSPGWVDSPPQERGADARRI